ncbi:MAG: hypothetical protein Q4F88_05605 [Eubacteriales bacterium]|nr:hypothetical protein [Eubacteriales bacterium]
MRKNIRIIIIGVIFFLNIFSFNSFAGFVNVGSKVQYVDDTTNQVVKNQWLQSNAGYYYLDSEGYVTIGWKEIDNNWRYFNAQGIMCVAWLELNGDTYYLKSDGIMTTGWLKQTLDQVVTYYYFGTNGKMTKGWKQIDSSWYYFLNTGGAIINEWAKINNKWYHFGSDAQMTTGWYTNGDNYYFLNTTNGEMVTGWVTDKDGYSYYLDLDTGVLLRNTTRTISNVTYVFGSDGKVTSKTELSANEAQNVSVLQNANSIQNNSEVIVIGEKPGSVTSNTTTTTTNQNSSIISPETYVTVDEYGNLVQGNTKGPK